MAATCAASVVAAPTTAHAQTVGDEDAVGDMVSLDYESGELTPVPERRLNDVERTKLTHRTGRVAIRVDYVDLRRKPGGATQVLDVTMVTNEGVRRHLQLAAYPRRWSGEAEMYTGRWRTMACPVRHSIDYRANVVKVSFPRRCAGNPRWLHFRVGSFVEGGAVFFVDDALRDRPLTMDDRRFARSDRVYRAAAAGARS